MGRMADVLVGAKQQAEKIILERLNGYNCVKQYVAMGTLLANISRKKEELVVLKRHVMEVSVGLVSSECIKENELILSKNPCKNQLKQFPCNISCLSLI